MYMCWYRCCKRAAVPEKMRGGCEAVRGTTGGHGHGLWRPARPGPGPATQLEAGRGTWRILMVRKLIRYACGIVTLSLVLVLVI